MIASTAGKVFVDTNVLVYCYDMRDPAKHATALTLTETLARTSRLAISAQVLNEFYAAVTRPTRPQSIEPTRAMRIVRRYIAIAQVLPLSSSTTILAFKGMARYGLPLWDALIWAVAKENGIPLLYTEDFQHGQNMDGVQILNPFLPSTKP
jgi:predicted nucleic acid-binding protein